MASGPSMTQADAAYCRGKALVVTVNSTWRLSPWADVHYSSDADWWQHELDDMRAACAGQFWTGHPVEIAADIRSLPYDRAVRGLSKVPGRIAWGGNSGYCAIGLAHQFGAARVILLGYDMQGDTHWHGEHDPSIRKSFNFPMWRQRFVEMANDARRVGMEIINCSRESSLDCFPRSRIEDALC